jgi:hypothetical protein
MITIRMAPTQLGMHEPVDCSMDARSAAALGLFCRARLTVEVLDELHWRIMPEIALSSVGA